MTSYRLQSVGILSGEKKKVSNPSGVSVEKIISPHAGTSVEKRKVGSGT